MRAFACYALRLGSLTSRKFEAPLEEIEGAVIRAGYDPDPYLTAILSSLQPIPNWDHSGHHGGGVGFFHFSSWHYCRDAQARCRASPASFGALALALEKKVGGGGERAQLLLEYYLCRSDIGFKLF